MASGFVCALPHVFWRVRSLPQGSVSWRVVSVSPFLWEEQRFSLIALAIRQACAHRKMGAIDGTFKAWLDCCLCRHRALQRQAGNRIGWKASRGRLHFQGQAVLCRTNHRVQRFSNSSSRFLGCPVEKGRYPHLKPNCALRFR
jgi:hypothetical protein